MQLLIYACEVIEVKHLKVKYLAFNYTTSKQRCLSDERRETWYLSEYPAPSEDWTRMAGSYICIASDANHWALSLSIIIMRIYMASYYSRGAYSTATIWRIVLVIQQLPSLSHYTWMDCSKDVWAKCLAQGHNIDTSVSQRWETWYFSENPTPKWNESGFRPPLCTYRLNWARRSSWGWWDDWDDTVL